MMITACRGERRFIPEMHIFCFFHPKCFESFFLQKRELSLEIFSCERFDILFLFFSMQCHTCVMCQELHYWHWRILWSIKFAVSNFIYTVFSTVTLSTHTLYILTCRISENTSERWPDTLCLCENDHPTRASLFVIKPNQPKTLKTSRPSRSMPLHSRKESGER